MNRFTKGNHEITPKIPSRCTVEQYAKIMESKNQHSENQQMLAENILKKSEHMIDLTRQRTEQCKNETDYRIKERIQNIQFLTDEVAKQKRESSTEEDTVKVYCKRVINAVKFIKTLIERNDQQFKILHDNRDNVQLTNDPVDRQLRIENELFRVSHDKLDKTLKQLIEECRLLRTKIYCLDNELLRKSTSLQIDKVNLDLRSNFETMQLTKPSMLKDPTTTTQQEWEDLTYKLVQKSSQEIASSKQLRSFVDILLNRTIEELSKQVDRTSDEFRRRIEDTRYAKQTLEGLQQQTQQKISDIIKNITELQNELDAKESYLALCHNRLENRALRPGTELCKDRVQETLITELQTLQQTIHHLKHMIDESMATKRYLLHTKMLQDEEMNRLLHRLQVDEVDCMTIRDTIEFTPF